MAEEVFGRTVMEPVYASLMVCCPYTGVFSGERE